MADPTPDTPSPGEPHMKTMAEFLIPGLLFPESYTREVPSRDPLTVMWQATDNVFAFVVYDVAEAPDLGPEFKVTPVRQNVSGRHYIEAEEFTVEQVEAMGDDYRILTSNMRSNGWNRVVRCRTGNWQPLTDDDVVLWPEGAAT